MRWITLLLMLTLPACTSPAGPAGAPPASPRAAATPAAPGGAPSPGGSPTAGYEAQIQILGPSAVLSRRLQEVWPDSPTLPFRVALLEALSDQGNPLGFTDAELAKVDWDLRVYSLEGDRLDFRMTRLNALSNEGWEKNSSGLNVQRAPVAEEVLIAAIDPAVEDLTKKAGGAKAEASRLPEDLQAQPDQPLRPMREAPADWQEGIPETEEISSAYLAALLPEWVEGLEGQKAAQAAAELEALKKTLQARRDALGQLVELAVANPDRQKKVVDRATQLQDEEAVDLAEAEEAAVKWLEARQAAGKKPSAT